MENLIELDVSDLEAPEPLLVILKHLPMLTSDMQMKIKHRIEPKGLYRYLKNYNYEVKKFDEGSYEIRIWCK